MSFYETYDRDYTGVKEQNQKNRKESESKTPQERQRERQQREEQENTYRFRWIAEKSSGIRCIRVSPCIRRWNGSCGTFLPMCWAVIRATRQIRSIRFRMQTTCKAEGGLRAAFCFVRAPSDLFSFHLDFTFCS